MQLVDLARLGSNREHTGLWYHRDADAFRLGYLRQGHPEGPELVWRASGIEAQWHRAPLLPWAESTLHGPTWRWHPDGSPAHDALFEHYLCLRQRAITPTGETRPTRRFAEPEVSDLWTARSSPVRDVAYWTDEGALAHAPWHDPGPIQPLPPALLRPDRPPEALVRALAPLTRRAVYQPPPGLEARLAALERAVDEAPTDLDAWAVLADAQAEADHPEGAAATRIVTILRASDVDHALRAARQLGPIDDWVRVVAERAWTRSDAAGVQRALALLGVELSPGDQASVERTARRAGLDPRGALRVLAELGRSPRTPGRSALHPAVPGQPHDPDPRWIGMVEDPRRAQLYVHPDGTEVPLVLRLTEPAARLAAAPVPVPERVLRRYQRFVPVGSIGAGLGRW